MRLATSNAIGRAGVGVLLSRVGGDAPRQARIITALRDRLPQERASAGVVRGSSELRSLIDRSGPIGDSVALMRAIKQRFDPQGILNPGREPGGP